VPVVEALVGLLPAESGGLDGPVPSGTCSLLRAFAPIERRGEDVKIGTVSDVIGVRELVPGSAGVPVIVGFWADEAAVYAIPGAAFALWYGRHVGAGVVTRIADEAARG
jgi:hypothetical protein